MPNPLDSAPTATSLARRSRQVAFVLSKDDVDLLLRLAKRRGLSHHKLAAHLVHWALEQVPFEESRPNAAELRAMNE